MTRERLPSGTILQKAYGILDKHKISRTFFVKADQEECTLGDPISDPPKGAPASATAAKEAVKDEPVEAADHQPVKDEQVKVKEQVKEVPVKQPVNDVPAKV